VLSTTSCSLMRAGVEACRVPLTGEEAGPTAGAAGLDSRCNMSGCLPMIGGSCGGVTAWNTVSLRKAPRGVNYLIYLDEIRLAFLGDSQRSSRRPTAIVSETYSEGGSLCGYQPLNRWPGDGHG
jgi:hypothetical protein